MRYDLIWKKIDEEITLEEKHIFEELVVNDASYAQKLKEAENMELVLSNHFNHKMDASFLVKLKSVILEDLELPSIRMNFWPIAIFIGLSLLISLLFRAIPLESSSMNSIDLSVYNPYISMVTAISFGGLLLFCLDSILKSKFN